jgi:hypothetical protein
LRWLGISRRERHSVRELAIEADLECILARAGQRNVKHEHGTGLHIYHAGGRLTELNRAFASQELAATLIDEADPDGMHADLGPAAANSENQMGTGVDRGKVRQPDVLEHAQHAEFALLVNQGVVSDNGKVEVQLS